MSNKEARKNLIDAFMSYFKNDADGEEDEKDKDQTQNNGDDSEDEKENTGKKNDGEGSEEDDEKENTGKKNDGEDDEEDDKEVENKISNAVMAERERISEIQKISSGIDADLVQEAMFGETACNAAELALRAKEREDAKQSKSLENLKKDSAESNANDVSAKPGEIAADTLKEADEREAAVKVLREKLSKGGK